MLRDFRLDVTELGSEVRVNATFQDGWKPLFFPILNAGHPICRNWQCLEYSAWLRGVEFRITVPVNSAPTWRLPEDQFPWMA